MSKRTESLSQAKLDIFNEIINAKGNYASYSPIEKLQYVETAFNNVNNYYSNVLFGLNPNNTKFGFMLGRSSTATTFGGVRAIGYNLRTALMQDDPMEVYRVMFHEYRHVWQDNASLSSIEIPLPKVLRPKRYSPIIPKPVVKAIDTIVRPAKNVATTLLKPFKIISRTCLYNGKNRNYTMSMHEASLNEIDADNSAYKNLAGVFKEGILKSSEPVKASKLLGINSKNWTEDMKFHAKAVVNILSGGRLFVNPTDKMLKESGQRSVLKVKGMCFISTSQATQVIERNPKYFESKKAMQGAGDVFRKYIKEHGEERHLLENFFGSFSPYTFRRYAKNAEFARYDTNGKLIDQEELFFLEYSKHSQTQPRAQFQKQNTTITINAQNQAQSLTNKYPDRVVAFVQKTKGIQETDSDIQPNVTVSANQTSDLRIGDSVKVEKRATQTSTDTQIDNMEQIDSIEVSTSVQTGDIQTQAGDISKEDFIQEGSVVELQNIEVIGEQDSNFEEIKAHFSTLEQQNIQSNGETEIPHESTELGTIIESELEL